MDYDHDMPTYIQEMADWLDDDARTRAFSSGLSEDVLDRLARVAELRVASRGDAWSLPDNAPSELVKAALALPMSQGVDADSIWSALALALRERKDPARYVAAIREYKIADAQQILDFITSVRTSTDPVEAERLLDGLDITLRGHAYSAAVVVLGTKAPKEWRRAARRLLFIAERPYFATAGAEAEVERTQPRIS
jgi:hypothetical protein